MKRLLAKKTFHSRVAKQIVSTNKISKKTSSSVLHLLHTRSKVAEVVDLTFGMASLTDTQRKVDPIWEMETLLVNRIGIGRLISLTIYLYTHPVGLGDMNPVGSWFTYTRVRGFVQVTLNTTLSHFEDIYTSVITCCEFFFRILYF
ncbi:unnamed protein product [Arabidopsis halleri]